jgi:hypothetical protein
MRGLILLYFFACALPVAAATPTPTPQPFWKAKPEVYRKIIDERAVMVSAHRTELANARTTFDVKGGWLVSAPRDFVFRTISDYSRLGLMSEMFKDVKWDAALHRLSLRIEALGYKEEFVVELKSISKPDCDEVQFTVTQGEFKGLSGFIGLSDQGFAKTEMSIDATLTTAQPPLPKSFMTFAMEVITQKVAERLRHYLEEQAAPHKTGPS